jgi:parvulin-like peptidyl-prolyl isomerase
MKINDIPSITKSSFIPGAGRNDKVVKFAFNESEGSVSQPIKINGGYAVYHLVERKPPGYASFEQIKDNTVAAMVRQQKKLEMLKQKADEMRSKIVNNDLNSLKQVDPGINVVSVDSFSVSKPYQAIGSDYDFEYTLFKLNDGQLSEPIKTNKGYYIVHMLQITPFDQKKFDSEKDSIRSSMIDTKKQAITAQWIQDLKDRADIVDNRDKFFR